eukprot:INCI12611.2.p1 GENE.INCI12611.2~~INCI12611.2.p1  ORF type:complete len:484 (-),score=100.39 INCI12611.2:1481-2932(-)
MADDAGGDPANNSAGVAAAAVVEGRASISAETSESSPAVADSAADSKSEPQQDLGQHQAQEAGVQNHAEEESQQEQQATVTPNAGDAQTETADAATDVAAAPATQNQEEDTQDTQERGDSNDERPQQTERDAGEETTEPQPIVAGTEESAGDPEAGDSDSTRDNQLEQSHSLQAEAPGAQYQAAASTPERTQQQEDDESSSDEPDTSSFSRNRRMPCDSMHIHRSHVNAILQRKDEVKDGLDEDGAGSSAPSANSSDSAVETETPNLADVVEAVVEVRNQSPEGRRPMPPALPNEVQFEVTYFTPSLGLRLKWQDRRIVVTGSVPPFDAEYADQIAAQPQIDEGDFLTAVGDFNCVGFGAFSDAVALIKSSPRPLTLTFRRNILKKNRAMIVTENVWTNIKKKGMSLLGKVKKYAVEHLGSPTNGHGGVSSVEGGGTVHTLTPAASASAGGAATLGPVDHDNLAAYDSPIKRPPPMEAVPKRP